MGRAVRGAALTERDLPADLPLLFAVLTLLSSG
jgi:hypothetical protein